MTVSLNGTTMMVVGEGDGMVTVCAVLFSMENTERNFTITIASRNITGT